MRFAYRLSKELDALLPVHLFFVRGLLGAIRLIFFREKSLAKDAVLFWLVIERYRVER